MLILVFFSHVSWVTVSLSIHLSRNFPPLFTFSTPTSLYITLQSHSSIFITLFSLSLSTYYFSLFHRFPSKWHSKLWTPPPLLRRRLTSTPPPSAVSRHGQRGKGQSVPAASSPPKKNTWLSALLCSLAAAPPPPPPLRRRTTPKYNHHFPKYERPFHPPILPNWCTSALFVTRPSPPTKL